jgi:integrase
MLAENNVRTGFFDRESFDALRRHLPEAVQPVVTFAYVTGWRIKSEILPLQWRQVDLDAGTVRLDPGTTKNGEGRVIHLTTELRTVLEAQWAITDEYQRKHEKICAWVFHRNGKQILTIRRCWDTAAKAAGCPGRIPHDLRRTAVRNLVRAGVPERVSMQLTGHKTRSVFERYNIVSDTDLIEAARKLHVATATATIGQSGAPRLTEALPDQREMAVNAL